MLYKGNSNASIIDALPRQSLPSKLESNEKPIMAKLPLNEP